MRVHSGLIFPNLLVVSIYILPIIKKFKHFFCLWFFGFLLCPFFCWDSHWLLVSLQAFLLYSSDYYLLVLYTSIFMILFSVVSFPSFEKSVFCIVLLLPGFFFFNFKKFFTKFFHTGFC